jgi:TRAP-type C4-dicarboxylate transport system permease large subunit
MTDRPADPSKQAALRWPITLPCLLLLGALVAQWTGTQLCSSIVQVGEQMWPGYGAELRQEPEPPPPRPEPPPQRPEARSQRPTSVVDDVLGGFATQSADDAEREQYERALRQHEEAHRIHEDRLARRTAAVRTFSAIDRSLAGLVNWLNDHLHHIFVLLLGLCGVAATLHRRHIALRSIRGRLDDRVAQAVALVANLLLLAATVAQWQLRADAGTGTGDPLLAALWMGGFAAMALCNLGLLARPLPATTGEGGLGRALLCVPLYSVMAVLAGLYFVAVEGYVAGLAVYLEKLMQSAQLYLQVGLYVWAGMLLKRTDVAERAFAVLRPWHMPPELLAVVVVLLAAFPTAYSGASGIFVIAAGALIFRELRAAGARRGLALASTAMSGSMGVVLSPCLLVVIVGYLTGVPSDELFGWGRWVYLLTAALFTAVVLTTRSAPLRSAPDRDALPATGRALRALVPYGLIFLGVLAVCLLGLDSGLDQHTAPVMLPVMLLCILAFERWTRRGAGRGAHAQASSAPPTSTMTEPRPALAATDETTIHIGALLLLMALSAGLGGVIERSDMMALVPESLGSPWLAMTVLVVVLVLIGMVMDPYGAVILVHATLAKVADTNGIEEVHFWMVVLVAFELGYLTPPVALNHLLARQVIDDDAALEPEAGSLWRRHERYLLPITVMGLALLLVAFVPLAWR